MMSYCGGSSGVGAWRWIAKDEYKFLIGAVGRGPTTTTVAPPTGTIADNPPGPESDYLLVRGSLDLTTGAVAFDPFTTLRTRATLPAQQAGSFAIRLTDRGGATLATVPFEAHAEHPDLPAGETNTALFIVPVAAPPGVARADVILSGKVIGTRIASAGAPRCT